ncbi:MAG: hypothetical protein NPIRA02_23810 [Nitrospirales bacterium]|nr:MAG: hypothetical protein NPIRA02_23810 [Nitrospirales bacterium]
MGNVSRENLFDPISSYDASHITVEICEKDLARLLRSIYSKEKHHYVILLYDAWDPPEGSQQSLTTVAHTDIMDILE